MLGVHVTLALTQLEQGVFRSHLIFRCWQRTQARTLGALPAAVEVEEGVGAPVEEDIVSPRIDDWRGEGTLEDDGAASEGTSVG